MHEQASQELSSLCPKPEEAKLRGRLMPSLILFILHYFTIIIYLSVCVYVCTDVCMHMSPEVDVRCCPVLHSNLLIF